MANVGRGTMEIEFVDFYPHHKVKKGFGGHAHVYLPEIGADLRGVKVSYNTESKNYTVKQAGASYPDTNNPQEEVPITYFSIRDVVEKKLFLMKLKRVIEDGIVKKYGRVGMVPDMSKMVFLNDMARNSDWMKRKFEYLKNQLMVRNIPLDSPKKPFIRKKADNDFRGSAPYRPRTNFVR